MARLSEEERQKLQELVDKYGKEWHQHIHEVEEEFAKPPILRVRWWAWIVGALALVGLWQLVRYVESIVVRAG